MLFSKSVSQLTSLFSILIESQSVYDFRANCFLIVILCSLYAYISCGALHFKNLPSHKSLRRDSFVDFVSDLLDYSVIGDGAE